MKTKRYFLVACLLMAVAFAAFKPMASKTKSATDRDRAPFPLKATLWKIDRVHSNVRFSVSHLLVSDVEGTFKSFDGTVESAKADFSDAKINFSVDVGSVNTDNENRDKHVKSDDFFNAEKFPQMKFVSSSFQPLGNNQYKLTGDLTIRDVTKPVSFGVTYGGTVSAMGAVHAGFKVKTTVNRFDYDLKWDKTLEAGGMIVGKEVEITLNIDIVKS